MLEPGCDGERVAALPTEGAAARRAGAGPETGDAAGAQFPDCWLAYGATDSELDAYGPTVPLASGTAWLVAAQAAVAAGLLVVVLGTTPAAVRWIAAAACLAVLASGIVRALRLLATPRALTLRREHLALVSLRGSLICILWESVAEIGLVSTPTRSAVGLRRRLLVRGATGRWQPGRTRWLASGFDYLLYPRDGHVDLLGRVLLRYCIDAPARGRLPADAS
jgi:hypothetical protein